MRCRQEQAKSFLRLGVESRTTARHNAPPNVRLDSIRRAWREIGNLFAIGKNLWKRFMAGGETNPLGARAMYLGNTEYRIHGTNQPSSIGTFVSSGCIRLTNEDVEDLYSRVTVGTTVIVLPGANTAASQLRPRH
jgi:hypothetical protein